jgi:hypothetical protein
MYRLIWLVPTAIVAGFGVAAVTGNLDNSHEQLFQAIVVGLWAFSVASAIVVYRRKRI